MDLKIVKELGDFLIALRADIVKSIKRRDQPLAHLASVIHTERHADDLESRAVVLLKQPRHQMRHRVPPKICRQIGDPHLVVTPLRAGPQWPWERWNPVSGKVPAALQ